VTQACGSSRSAGRSWTRLCGGSTAAPADGLVFAGPGGANQIKAGSRTALSVGNLRRVYKGQLCAPSWAT
jgi:hypothetical protein